MFDQELMPLYQATAEGQGVIYLDHHPELVDHAVVTRVTADVSSCVRSQSFGDLQVITMTRSIVLGRLGDEHGSMSSMIDCQSAAFAVATTVDEYHQVHGALVDVSARCAQNGWPDLQWKALINAADCDWFASGEAEGGQGDADLIRGCHDLAQAFEVAGAHPELLADDQFTLQRSASLLGVLAGKAMSRVWLDAGNDGSAALRRLWTAADPVLPVDFAFDEQMGGAAKTSALAAVLTQLSDEFG
jgi:hypothetical protein